MIEIIQGDCLQSLRAQPDGKFRCCVSSPPYYGLRDYGHKGQIGLEETPQQYVDKIVLVFREVKRTLTDDGTLWLNLGDSYATNGGAHGGRSDNQRGVSAKRTHAAGGGDQAQRRAPSGLKPKDLIGIPWRVAFALQADGWYLRSDIIWAKPNCMPESVTDRPTRSHEYLFLLAKSEQYFYDHEAIKEPASQSSIDRWNQDVESQDGSVRANGGAKTNGAMKAVGGPKNDKQRGHSRRHAGFNDRWDSMSKEEQCSGTRNKRDVWTVPPAQYANAHFATFPVALITPCILAGSAPGDSILDPFGGSGTTGEVALSLGRKCTLLELNPDYCALARARCQTTVGFQFL